MSDCVLMDFFTHSRDAFRAFFFFFLLYFHLYLLECNVSIRIIEIVPLFHRMVQLAVLATVNRNKVRPVSYLKRVLNLMEFINVVMKVVPPVCLIPILPILPKFILKVYCSVDRSLEFLQGSPVEYVSMYACPRFNTYRPNKNQQTRQPNPQHLLGYKVYIVGPTTVKSNEMCTKHIY